VKKVIEVLTNNFEKLDIRSIVLLFYTIARLRYPCDALIRKFLTSFELNYKDMEPKDVTLIGWSAMRLGIKNKNFIDAWRSRFFSFINRALQTDQTLHL
jgi:hypothetical protein